MKEVTIKKGQKVIPRQRYLKKGITSVQISKTVKVIHEEAFMGCRCLRHIELPDTLEVVGRQAFAEAGIEDVEIPKGLIELGEGAYMKCRHLKRAFFPQKYIPKEIPVRCFAGNRNFEKVVLPDSLQRIGARAFHWCLAMEEVELPGDLRVIGNGAFEWSGLKYVEVPEEVESLGMNAFRCCKELEYAVVKGAWLEIGANAFRGCMKLKEIEFWQDPYKIGENIVSRESGVLIRCLPGGRMHQYCLKNRLKVDVLKIGISCIVKQL